MNVERRTMLAAVAASFGAAAGPAALGCTLVGAAKHRQFSNEDCLREIRELVRMLNEAPNMDSAAVDAWAQDRSISIEGGLFREEQDDLAEFVKTFRLSDGKLDTKKLRLVDVALVRQRENQAAYAFTLRRHSYHAADEEGCNGMFTHDAFWADEEEAYIASFQNNRMTRLREFLEWFPSRSGV